MTYRAPVETIQFTLEAITALSEDIAAGHAGSLTQDLVPSIIEEAGRFAQERLAPLNWQGDQCGAQFDQGHVAMPPGWDQIYQDWAQAGWNSVDLDPHWGGMGLPTRLATVAMEFWTSACMSFALGPVLTQGAVDTLLLHADEALKKTYLPKLVSGEWTATMNLTEPQAGSDLGALTTRAYRQDDGTYRLKGNKIFITYGEHDLTPNIIHLVLARLPDAPIGTKGISLFLVPKFLVDEHQHPIQRNDVTCAGLEHKVGIHASPTCSMVFGDQDGAVGWLIGEENRGLNCMFTMMNKARLYTGLQGVAIAERAYQKALEFSKVRVQGRAALANSKASSSIIEHPDVRRNLHKMRALTSAARAIAYAAARAIDLAHMADDPAVRKKAMTRAALLTPVTKAWCTDAGVEVASIGIQIHGGMGYVEETGAAQYWRDARIAPIYEGTNGIQAIDLVTRKVLVAERDDLQDFFEELTTIAKKSHEPLGAAAQTLGEAVEILKTATQWLDTHAHDMKSVLSAATPYLNLFGTVSGAVWLAQGALYAQKQKQAGDNKRVYDQAIMDARFFAQNFAVHAGALFQSMQAEVSPSDDFE